MSKLPLNFITLHYAYIISCGILGLVVLYPYGNLKAIDAYFFGASAATESGLNTVDVKLLKTYQQVFIYVIPIITNLMFVNAFVVAVRLHWFEKQLKQIAPTVLSGKARSTGSNGRDARGAQAMDLIIPEPWKQSCQALERYSDVERHKTASIETSSSQSTDETAAPQDSTTRSIAFADPVLSPS